MIIIRTKKGDLVYCYAAVEKVVLHSEEHVANIFEWKKETIIKDVENVIYVNEQTGTVWKDEGSEVQKLKAEIEKMQKDRGQAWEHFDSMRECFLIYHNAVMWIADELDSKAEPSSKVAAIRLFVQETEKKYNEAVARFEDLKQRWEDDRLRTTEGSEGEMPE